MLPCGSVSRGQVLDHGQTGNDTSGPDYVRAADDSGGHCKQHMLVCFDGLSITPNCLFAVSSARLANSERAQERKQLLPLFVAQSQRERVTRDRTRFCA